MGVHLKCGTSCLEFATVRDDEMDSHAHCSVGKEVIVAQAIGLH